MTKANASVANRIRLTGLAVVALLLQGCAPPPAPLMKPYRPISKVEICAGGVCGKAGEKFALKDIAQATAKLAALNAPSSITICEADRQTRRCLKKGLTYTVRGIIPVAALITHAELRSNVRYDNHHEVRMRMNIPSIVLGKSNKCEDARTVFSVKTAQHIIWNSTPYGCSWGGSPVNVTGDGRLGIQYIDFDQGIWAGEFSIRVTGVATAWKSGYVVARFELGMRDAEQAWLHPMDAQPALPQPTWAAATPTPQTVQPPPPLTFAAPIVTTPTPLALKARDVNGLGRYHALVIGNDRYQYVAPLASAVNDARAVAKLLQSAYGFNVQLLENADRTAILTALERLRGTLRKNDNLLIYYAGHGWLDTESDEGFWLPVDAQAESQLQWIPNSAVTRTLRAIAAKHVMVVADSCFSGKLARGLHINPKAPNYFQRIAKKRTRVVMSSGGLEPVLDSGGEGAHSVFTAAFLRGLQENKGIIEGNRLFMTLRHRVMLKADQTPEYADIRKAGHDGGDFLFYRHAREQQ